MKNIHFFLALSITLFIWSCTKDEPTLPKNHQVEDQKLPADLQVLVNDAINELESDYKITLSNEQSTSRSIVYVPANSVDALADAIDQAGRNGKVILESGNHWESETVLIEHKISLLGEDGAKLYVDVAGPGDPFPFPSTNTIDPAVYVKNCNNVWIKNIEINPDGASGSTGVFLENSRNTRVQNNAINNFQFGIWVSDNSKNARLYDNVVVGNAPEGVWGIIVESGRNAKLLGNHVSQYATCIFASDKNGIMLGNTTYGSFSGPLLCTVQGNVLLPNGSMLVNAIPCKDWVVANNKAYNSVWNYVVIDGANNNILILNESSNPGSGQDIFLVGDSNLTGMPTPTSSDNFVLNYETIVTVDCGLDNTVIGGTLLNGPCF